MEPIYETIKSKQGYDIPCANNLHGEKYAVIICHGFGSSKGSPTVKMLEQFLPEKGMGTFSFDFPGHGDSKAEDSLRVRYCIDDLAAVEAHVRQLAPDAEICYFASSFGAYILLLFLAEGRHAGRRAFLRSAAVDMQGLFPTLIDQQSYEHLMTEGWFLMDHDFIHPVKISKDFILDLKKYDVFELYQQEEADICMFHGDSDAVASPQFAMQFAIAKQARMRLIPGGQHDLMDSGQPEKIAKSAVYFFKGLGV